MRKVLKTREIEFINNEIKKLCDQVQELRIKKEKLKFESKNLQGKFIKCSRGFMFVTWQTDGTPLYEDGIMLQGLYFSSSFSDSYRDSAYFDFDCMKEWYMSNNEFYSDEVKEISKEEFVNEFTSKFSDVKNFGLNWIEKVEKNYYESE